jgi:hypothetical protein
MGAAFGTLTSGSRSAGGATPGSVTYLRGAGERGRGWRTLPYDRSWCGLRLLVGIGEEHFSRRIEPRILARRVRGLIEHTAHRYRLGTTDAGLRMSGRQSGVRGLDLPNAERLGWLQRVRLTICAERVGLDDDLRLV